MHHEELPSLEVYPSEAARAWSEKLETLSFTWTDPHRSIGRMTSEREAVDAEIVDLKNGFSNLVADGRAMGASHTEMHERIRGIIARTTEERSVVRERAMEILPYAIGGSLAMEAATESITAFDEGVRRGPFKTAVGAAEAGLSRSSELFSLIDKGEDERVAELKLLCEAVIEVTREAKREIEGRVGLMQGGFGRALDLLVEPVHGVQSADERRALDGVLALFRREVGPHVDQTLGEMGERYNAELDKLVRTFEEVRDMLS